MIRLLQRKLIIPRGDTGTFSIPALAIPSAGDIAIFSILDKLTQTKIFEKKIELTPAMNTILVEFTHGDTVNLKPGCYLWDIKIYHEPQYANDELINAAEIHSYYAGFSLPECEIRPTADQLLMADDAPTSTLSPDSLNIINAAINEALKNKNITLEASENAENKAAEAFESAENAAEFSERASQSAELVEARVNEIENLSVEISTGAKGSNASVSYTPATGILSFEIPRGDTGNGIASCVLNADFTLTINYTDGTSMTTVPIRGDTPHLTIGEVTEGPNAIATITGTDANPILNLTLPNANVPTRVSQLENDSGYLIEHQDLSDYVQKTDYATSSIAGVVKIGNGLYAGANGNITTYQASSSEIKSGTNSYNPITPKKIDAATFYGLAKAAGDTTQSQSSNAVGAYTDEAKAAIQQMLDVPSTSDIPTQVSELTNDAGYLTTETDPTVPAWAKEPTKPSYTAAEVGAPTIAEMEQAIANVNTMKIHICAQGEYDSETGVPTIQNPDTQTFYLVPGGEGNNLFIEWAYVNGAWERFGSADVDLSGYALKSEIPEVPIQDVQINGTSILENGVANVPVASDTLGLVRVLSSGQDGVRIRTEEGTRDKLVIVGATETEIKNRNNFKPVLPSHQHESTFYGLAKAAGDTTQSQSSNAVGQYTDEAKAAIQTMLDVPAKGDISEAPVQDVQVNGVSVLQDGVANVPLASTNNLGVVKVRVGDNGLRVDNSGILTTYPASSSDIKAGGQSYRQPAVNRQHESTFYGLAKAAGSDEKNSTLPVGQYTDNAKEAIQSMLGITQMLAPTNPNLVASQPYAIGDVFAANGHLYKATAAIEQDRAIIPDTNCVETTMAEAGGKIKDVQVAGTSVVGSDGVANIPIATDGVLGLVQTNWRNFGVIVNSAGQIYIGAASSSEIKEGAASYKPIVAKMEHEATFYGLSKVAGVDLANETVTLGTYPETSKTAIKTMLGVQDGLKVVRLI